MYVIARIELHSDHEGARYDFADGQDDLVEKAKRFGMFVGSEISLEAGSA